MFELAIYLYFGLLVAFLGKDLFLGAYDALPKNARIKMIKQAKHVFGHLLDAWQGYVDRAAERRAYQYATCAIERCDSFKSGAGKAIAMK